MQRRKIILASSSPRRRELLDLHGFDFVVVPPDPSAECGVCSRETPPELVARLAYQKAADVVKKIPEGMVLAADTVAECLGRILGKPEDRKHADEMLRFLSGREHAVYSGVCLWDAASSRRLLRVDVSKLYMRPLTEQEIDDYLDSDLWIGKAGAFGYQDEIEWLELREGSAENVVGLPIDLVDQMLFNFDQWAEPEIV